MHGGWHLRRGTCRITTACSGRRFAPPLMLSVRVPREATSASGRGCAKTQKSALTKKDFPPERMFIGQELLRTTPNGSPSTSTEAVAPRVKSGLTFLHSLGRFQPVATHAAGSRLEQGVSRHPVAADREELAKTNLFGHSCEPSPAPRCKLSQTSKIARFLRSTATGCCKRPSSFPVRCARRPQPANQENPWQSPAGELR